MLSFSVAVAGSGAVLIFIPSLRGSSRTTYHYQFKVAITLSESNRHDVAPPNVSPRFTPDNGICKAPAHRPHATRWTPLRCPHMQQRFCSVRGICVACYNGFMLSLRSRTAAVVFAVAAIGILIPLVLRYASDHSPEISTSVYSPAIRGLAEISYPFEFQARLASVSTIGWQTFRSKFGYQIQFPPSWRAIVCGNGFQVFFYASSDGALTCDSPHEGADFSILGPNSQQDEMSEATPSRLVETFSLDGTPAVRHVDFLAGQTGNDLLEEVVVNTDGGYLDLLIGNTSRTLWDEKMLTTFRVGPYLPAVRTSGLPTR